MHETNPTALRLEGRRTRTPDVKDVCQTILQTVPINLTSEQKLFSLCLVYEKTVI